MYQLVPPIGGDPKNKIQNGDTIPITRLVMMTYNNNNKKGVNIQIDLDLIVILRILIVLFSYFTIQV